MRVTLRDLGAWAALLAIGVLGCGDEEPAINRVGVNVVEKALFEGSWYMARTVIDVDYEGAGARHLPRRRRERRGADVHRAAAHPLGDRRGLPVRLPRLRADPGRRRREQGRSPRQRTKSA